MYCPDCREPMLILELSDVELDFCDSCHAVWLDAGELELLLDGAEAADPLLAALEAETETDEAKRRCPICSTVMLKAACGQGQTVILDRCPKGHGFWFDRGELRQVLELGRSGKVLALLNEMFAFEAASTPKE